MWRTLVTGWVSNEGEQSWYASKREIGAGGGRGPEAPFRYDRRGGPQQLLKGFLRHGPAGVEVPGSACSAYRGSCRSAFFLGLGKTIALRPSRRPVPGGAVCLFRPGGRLPGPLVVRDARPSFLARTAGPTSLLPHSARSAEMSAGHQPSPQFPTGVEHRLVKRVAVRLQLTG